MDGKGERGRGGEGEQQKRVALCWISNRLRTLSLVVVL